MGRAQAWDLPRRGDNGPTTQAKEVNVAQKKYGLIPPAPVFTAKVRGDAGTYRVWGIDWLHQRVLIDRAGLEWIAVEKIALEYLLPSSPTTPDAFTELLAALREQVAGDIESPSSSEPEYSRAARSLVTRIDAMLATLAAPTSDRDEQ